MNTLERKLTLQQERLAYRRAVRDTLCAFFGQSRKQADALVDAWWKRMGDGPVFRTGFFMHDEPVNTAADLVNVQTPAIRELGETYERILEDALPKRRIQRKQKVADQPRTAHAA